MQETHSSRDQVQHEFGRLFHYNVQFSGGSGIIQLDSHITTHRPDKPRGTFLSLVSNAVGLISWKLQLPQVTGYNTLLPELYLGLVSQTRLPKIHSVAIHSHLSGICQD